MKTQVLLLTLMTSIFATQIQAQNRTIVNANSSEISDNLDLRVVASVFGDSKNLQEFESRLNDPKLQISNLDLNNDNQVDYLRVIESVENRTHVVIIQSVLDRDVYQDVATIEVEKDRSNAVHIQVVGNTYMYGENYIYEPVYYATPLIYASFWISNYRPYYSSWSWNYYPTHYYAWNPYPVYRYRYNVNNCLNTHYSYNNYNYVNYRRSSYAVNVYNSRRANGYERQYPNHSFAKRNSNVNNRYELDQRRNTRNVGYSQNRNESPRVSNQQKREPLRNFTQNRNETPRVTNNTRDYSQNRNESPRVSSQQKTEPLRNFSQNRNETPKATTAIRDYSQNRNESPRVSSQQKTEPLRNFSQNRNETPRVSTPQRTELQRNFSQNRSQSPKVSSPQRTESRNDNFSSRNSSSRDNNNSSRSSNRRS
ncbi:MAG: hypothetical protein V4572_07880 [Bacteroidota bacterium]